MVQGTVALPVWNSNGIVWLCLESLCRQAKTDEGWELIVFEEYHMTMVGEAFFRDYIDRLKEVGCEKIKYITHFDRQPLAKKWVMMAREADETSEYFVLVASDNYYQPWMLRDFEKVYKTADWLIVTKGYFYDFFHDKVIKYDYQKLPVGLQMCANISKVKDFPLVDRWSGVDSWFARQIGHNIRYLDRSEHWRAQCCTNGLNNISKGRGKYFEHPEEPFCKTKITLDKIIPEDIYKRMMQITNHYANYKAIKEETGPGRHDKETGISARLSGSAVEADTDGTDKGESIMPEVRRAGTGNSGSGSTSQNSI